MLPSADQLFKNADFIFQQDLAPAHTAKSTKSWSNDHGVGVLDWPANSPDLNIESLWVIVKRKMRNKRPKNADELKATVKETVSGYVCNHGSPSGERDTASPRGRYGERLQRDSCLKKHMKKHHPLAGDSPWRHYRRDHNIRTAGRIHHPLLRLKLVSEAWPQSLGDTVSRSPLGEPWLHT